MTLVLAHRGARRHAPDNTLEAFAVARAQGADGVELDIHRCADGHLVLHHDADGGGIGLLAELELAEIRERAPAIPTLPEALDVLEGLLVNVEIKNLPHDPGHDPQRRVADALVRLLEDRGGRDRVVVSSFDLPAIDRVRALDDRLATGYLTFGMEPSTAIGLVVERGHGFWHPDRGSVVGRARDVVAAARREGVEVSVWTVDDPAEIVELAEAGAHAVITDVPDVALSVIGGGSPG